MPDTFLRRLFPLKLGLVLMAVLFLSSCSADKEQAVQDVLNQELVADETRDSLVPDLDGTVASDVASENLLPLCHPLESLVAPEPLIPVPQRVLWLGDSLELHDNTLSFQGDIEAIDTVVQEWVEGGTLVLSQAPSALLIVVHPHRDWDAMRVQCSYDLPDSPSAYFLQIQASGPQTRVDLVAASDSGLFLAAKTLTQLLGDKALQLPELAVLDAPAVPVRGVIEGFYGTPWTREDRVAMMKLLGDLKFNLYVFAPKADAMINPAWMRPYSAQQLAEIQELLQAAARQRIRVCWELHTGLAVTFSSPEQFDWMLAKFRSVGALGADCFVLAFDDIIKHLIPADEAVYGTYEAAQADFANRLSQELLKEFPGAMLGFVPIEYYTNHEDAQTDLAALGRDLSPGWQIAWTGPEIVSPTIDDADVQAAALLLGRPPLLADNYPVSDMVAAQGQIHLGPLVNRSSSIHGQLSGIAFNAMSLPFASLPALATAADYAWSGASYDPERSIRRAARWLVGEEFEESFAGLCRMNQSVQISGSSSVDLASMLSDAAKALLNEDVAGFAEAAVVLDQGPLSALRATASLLDQPEWSPLLDELSPWISAAVQAAVLMESALELVGLQLSGQSLDGPALDAFRTQLASWVEQPYRPGGCLFEDFLGLVDQNLPDTTTF